MTWLAGIPFTLQLTLVGALLIVDAGLAAIGQCFAGARTLAPRLAAKAGIPLSRVLAGSAPAALLWVCAISTGGALLATAITLL